MSEKFKNKYGDYALVTGASSGLGTDFARQLASKGLNLVLVARSLDKLKSLAEKLKSEYSINVTSIKADLTKPDFMKAIKSRTEKLEIGLLVNNAGFGNSGNFLENPLKEELSMIRLHCSAPVELTHHFGQRMKERQKGGIIFLGSLLGYFGTPTLSNYSATKGWNILFAESLAGELKRDGIDVLSAAPGATITEFADKANMNIALVMKSKVVVRLALATLGKRPAIIIGLRNKFNYYSILPVGRRFGSFMFGSIMRIFSKKKL